MLLLGAFVHTISSLYRYASTTTGYVLLVRVHDDSTPNGHCLGQRMRMLLVIAKGFSALAG